MMIKDAKRPFQLVLPVRSIPNGTMVTKVGGSVEFHFHRCMQFHAYGSKGIMIHMHEKVRNMNAVCEVKDDDSYAVLIPADYSSGINVVHLEDEVNLSMSFASSLELTQFMDRVLRLEEKLEQEERKGTE